MLHSSQVCSEVDSTYRGPSQNKPGCNQINTSREFSSQKRRKKVFFKNRGFFTYPDCSSTVPPPPLTSALTPQIPHFSNTTDLAHSPLHILFHTPSSQLPLLTSHTTAFDKLALPLKVHFRVCLGSISVF